jgi:hypothetical protein
LIKLFALLPPPEDDPPDPAAPTDEPGDAVDAPAIAEDADIPGDIVAMELPDAAVGAAWFILASDLAIPAVASLVADLVRSTAAGALDAPPESVR